MNQLVNPRNPPKRGVFTTLFFIVFLFLSFYFGYLSDGWWKFIPSTALIILLTKAYFSGSFLSILGLQISSRQLLLAIFIAPIFWLISNFAIKFALNGSKFATKNGCWLDYICPPFQTLNEEFIFRALFLGFLLSMGLRKIPVIVFPAIIFAIFHWFFYKFNYSEYDRGELSFISFMTLAFFGIAMNIIYIQTNSVLIPWAIHLSWNLNRFGSHIVFLDNPNIRLRELDGFNALEGSLPVFFLSCILVLLCFILPFFLQKNKNKWGFL